MKKFLFSIICISFVFCNITTSVVAKQSIVNDDNYEKLDYLETSTESKGALQKVVKFIATAIVGGLVYDVSKYILATEVDMSAVYQWAYENSLNVSDFNIQIKEVVYDNGCWKPEYPNNPFCKGIN